MKRLLMSFLVTLSAPAVFAQAVQIPPAADPGQVQQRTLERQRELEEIERRERRIERPIERAPEPAQAMPPGAPAVRFFVRSIEFTPSEILEPAALAAIAAEYEGRSLTLADLQAVADRVNGLYRERGVVTARAVVPPQEVKDGVVRIRLVEGRVGALRLDGNLNTGADYVLRRMRTGPGRLVDLQALERDILLFNRTNDAQLRAEVLPGGGFGETDIALQLVEPPRHALRLFTDNGGARAVGELRLGLTYALRSVTGRRDEFSVTQIAARGQDGSYFFYGFPVNGHGGRVQFGYFHDRTRIVEGPIAPLRVTGESATSQFTFRQPFWVGRAGFGELLLGGKTRRSINWIDTQLLQSTDTRDLNFGFEASVSPGPGQFALLSVSRTTGQVAPQGGTERAYQYTRGSLRWLRPLPHDISLTTSFAFQLNHTELLPSGEQFLIGGDGTVRGYGTGLFAGDRGFTFGVEGMMPLARREDGVTWNGFLFADYGEVRPFRPPNSIRGVDALLGFGGGLLLQISRGSFARLTLSAPMRQVEEEPKDIRLNFQLVWSAF